MARTICSICVCYLICNVPVVILKIAYGSSDASNGNHYVILIGSFHM